MSASHYQIILTKANSYVFVTDSGFTYEVYFDRQTGMFPDERIDQYSVFLGFTCSPTTEVFRRNHDPKVGETIMYIIASFFKAYPHSVLSYVCSAADGQSRHRQISFSKWYASSLLKEKYKLLKRAYCGIFYSYSHPEFTMIEDCFTDFDFNYKPGVLEPEFMYGFEDDEEE